MASLTRHGKKNRVVATLCELIVEVPSSNASCKGSLSLLNSQANISTSLSQTTNVQAPSQRISPRATTLASQTTLNSVDSDHSLKRKGRGPTRGKGTDDIITTARKISLDISKKSGRAIGNQQARLANECGYIVRSFAPLRYKRWIDIPKHEKNTLYDRVLERMLEIKEQPILEESQAPTEFELMQEILGKCRGYIRGLEHGPKPASSHIIVDLTSTDTESIALREKIDK
ncbi:Uncharacterized protein Adt_14032 [Abeliophyllum distichum]|uniref:Uncharacterized protein n=1 Tax=Abeliophyllum distichum TaxID=126358 RepID=A0ABD1TYH0_9LAMI